ncbi:MAG TPA: heavy metal sensor histidine kinase, partial [Burkholderiales bacterium]|nr:heavy metal sensor histidine kinase [Burkholderiales bacterium]
MTAERAYPLERRSGSGRPAQPAIHRLISRAALLFSRQGMARVPLRLRLALYYAVFAGALVGTVILASYWQLSVALRDRAYAELRGEWQLVREALARTTRAALMENSADAIAALRADHPGLSIAVLASDVSMRVALGQESAELAAVASALEGKEILEFDWDDCRLAAVAGPAELAGGTAVRLAVGIDRTADRELLAARRNWLVLLSIASMILIGALAAVIARLSLAPLRTFSDQVSAISATQLARRMDESNVPQELQEFARTFNRLLENLDEAFNRLRAFSSDIAHELRTPLANLSGKTQLTLSRVRTAAEYRQTLEANAEELEHMMHMVANMVFLAQVENAVAALEQDDVDLLALCEEVAEFYQVAGEERAVHIEVTGRGRVRGDRRLIQRALGNLLSNAIRHTPSGEAIRIRITAPAGEAAVIEVENPGQGIAPELQSRIFERF